MALRGVAAVRRWRRQGGGEAAAPSTTTTAAAAPVAPLTGLPDPDGAAQTRPVLSVKVENTPQARPQSGLDAADVVWDEVVEGQITRLLAMFQSRSPPTSSARSARCG